MLAPQLQFQGLSGFDNQQQFQPQPQQNFFQNIGMDPPQQFYQPQMADQYGQVGQQFSYEQPEQAFQFYDQQQDGYQVPSGVLGQAPAGDQVIMAPPMQGMTFQFYAEPTPTTDTTGQPSTPVNSQFVDVSLDNVDKQEQQPKKQTRAAEVKKRKKSKFGCC